MADVFIEAQDVKALATRVIRENEQFNHINPRYILFLSKEGNSATKIAYVRGLRGDLAMLSEYKYILCVVQGNYNALTDEGKAKVIEHELLHLTPEMDGKVVNHDIKDFRAMLEKYGVNYVRDAHMGDDADL